MLVVGHVVALLHGKTELSSVLLECFQCLVLADILAELVISVRIGLLREVDGVLNDSHIIFVDHVLAVGHLQHNIALRQLNVLQVASCCGQNAVQIVLRLSVNNA